MTSHLPKKKRIHYRISLLRRGKVVPIRQAAQILDINTSTVHRWLNDSFIAGEQITQGAPWQIRITDELPARFVEQAPPGYLPMLQTP